MSERSPQIKRSKTGKVVGAIAFASGLTAGAVLASDSGSNSGPANIVRTGEVIPTGDTATPYKGHPGEWVIHGSNHQWGQTEPGYPAYIAGISSETNSGPPPNTPSIPVQDQPIGLNYKGPTGWGLRQELKHPLEYAEAASSGQALLVPKGEQSPVSETVSVDPSNPHDSIVQFGQENGPGSTTPHTEIVRGILPTQRPDYPPIEVS